MTFVSRIAALFLAFASLPAFAQAMDPSELPPVDSVFQLSATAPARERIEVRWKIAPGYYLYRHRTNVEVLGNAYQAGALQIPVGKKHHDEFFGDVETYRSELKVTLPGKATAGTDALALRIKYQGCADVGVCYPPQTRTVNVSLPAGANDASGDTGFAAFGSRLGEGAGGAQSGGIASGQNALPLPPAQAFKVEAIADGGSRLLLRVTPARGYYLYRDKLKLALSSAQGVSLGKPNYPKADDYRDEYFGNVKVYFDQVEIPVPLVRTEAGAKAQTVTLNASWQGCQKNGICYEPMKASYKLELPVATSTTKTTAVATTAATPGQIEATSSTTSAQEDDVDAASSSDSATSPSTETSTNAASTQSNEASSPNTGTNNATPKARIGLLTALLLALGGGLILNLMPCVLPVLSLKALSLAQSGESREHARRHALAYTIGVLAAFAVLGAIVLAVRGQLVESGMGWGFQLQMPGILATLALVVFAFGLSLSGLWYAQIAVPQSGLAMSQRAGWRGDFVTGVLAVVLATPCTAPFMGAALAYAFVAPAPLAMAVFLMLGLGLALPFLLIGFVPGFARLLPKPGAWMETMKQLLAFPMYATAAWLVWVLAQQRGADAFGLWALAAIALALALWAWTHARRHGKRWALGLAAVALMGSAFAVYSISQLQPPTPVYPGTKQRDMPYTAETLAARRAEGRPVFVNITADWCITCKTNERTVFAREDFRQALSEANAVYLVGDHTDVDPAISAFLREHGAVGLPLYVVYPAGNGAPVILPTLLTPTIARDALRAASAQ